VKRFGPPITSPQHSAKFTNKYIKNKDIFSGPWIHEDGRWVVEIKRDFTKAEDLLAKKILSGNLEGIGLGKYIKMKIPSAKIYVDIEIVSLLNETPGFLEFFTKYLVKTPKWLIKSS